MLKSLRRSIITIIKLEFQWWNPQVVGATEMCWYYCVANIAKIALHVWTKISHHQEHWSVQDQKLLTQSVSGKYKTINKIKGRIESIDNYPGKKLYRIMSSSETPSQPVQLDLLPLDILMACAFPYWSNSLHLFSYLINIAYSNAQ